ncbi:hypothetical protein QA601_00070 [Chitinispirillales bacterium ANBcel5]|uniref:hypothetical protein n=1 Tax=Cellulosispirillum alkaliphilum TaxID=3039283 RepID=UPI002A50F0DD|nr:hypothetical protein [Chitinispirillales bacterium ANBcel5]
MKAGFQHMGSIHIPLRALLEGIGVDVRLGPVPNRKTLELGARHSPEMVCLPFKVTLGNMIECLENGADTLLFIGSGDWSCRFGYYGRVQCSILEKLGYDFRPLFINRADLGSIKTEILRLNDGNYSKLVPRAFKSFVTAVYKSRITERIQWWARKMRPVERHDGDSDRAEQLLMKEVCAANTLSSLFGMLKRVNREFSSIKTDNQTNPLRVLIVGESYCVVEPLVNFNIIEYLGHSGVHVEPFLTSHKWLLGHALRIDTSKQLKKKKAIKLAKPLWAEGTGGEDQVSIGHAINARKMGFDGIIHLMPFGCMPETAALPVFESISKDKEIPLLNISLDEHSAQAGVCTRLEAFIDMLQQQRQFRNRTGEGKKNRAVLSGS